ncbi:hypothetical protein LJB42_000732 [Komagataella kurtzmanii]|nr:hypothetical protein LJB42_000732 [Komagataella kurtzmanii]
MTFEKSVAIIGGGPSGLATAKALAEEHVFDKIVIFEQQPQVGGVWNYSGTKPGNSPVPSDNPSITREWFANRDDEYVSPMYENLETNVIKDLMGYKDYPFPEACDILPSRQDVLEYVLNYAVDLKDPISVLVNKEVINLQKTGSEWRLRSRDLISQATTEDSFKYVIIATGHYNFPYVPDVPGLQEWAEADPSSISHSKYYINNQKFKGKKVLVIGNSASGADISLQLTEVTWPVYRSKKSEGIIKPVEIDDIIDISEIKRYDVSSRTATTADNTTISNIDHIIFCTGYLYDFPFLKSYMEGEDALITDGQITRRLHRQIFYIPDPSLSFVGIMKNIIPFPLAESQGAVIARVYSGRLELPCEAEMRKDEIEEIKKRGGESKFHSFATPTDVEYAQELASLVDKAVPFDAGFKAEIWTEEKKNRRVDFVDIKQQRHREHRERIKRDRKSEETSAQAEA